MKKIITTILIGFATCSAIGQSGDKWNLKGASIDGQFAQEGSGYVISSSGDGLTVVNGIPNNDQNGNNAGVVRVHTFNGTNWVQKGFTLTGASASDQFGSAVDISDNGNTIVVGVKGFDGGATNAGLVRVYDWNGVTWVQRGSDILGRAIADFAGGAVSISPAGDVIAIGTNSNDGAFNAGGTWVYQWNGSSWAQKGGDINGEASNDFSGALANTVSLGSDGNTVAIGAWANDGGGTDAGHVRVYFFNGASWVQRGPDIDGEAAGDKFGWSVHLSNLGIISGATVAIGAPGNDANGTDAGCVKVYRWTGSTWVLKGTRINGEAAGDMFGTSVALTTDATVLAGGGIENADAANLAGQVRVYSYDSDWDQISEDIDGESDLDRFGRGVSLSTDGNILATSSSSRDFTGLSNAGYIRVFERCEATSSSFVVEACGSYTVPSGKNTYTTSAVVRDTILNNCGADSTLHIGITIIDAATGTDVQSACGSYTWIDGNTYTSNNTSAKDTIVGGASNGCDSIVTLNLTITGAAMGTDVVTACRIHTWINGTSYFANNTTATHTIVGGASNGCDSIVTLNLTIKPERMGEDVIVSCGPYKWLDNSTYTIDNNTSSFRMIGGGSNGCDSIIKLNLTILDKGEGTDVQTACGSYTWIDGNTYTSNNTTAMHTIVGGSANGCDSIVTLNLTITSSATGTDVQLACGSYTWIDGNTYIANNNTAKDTIVGGASNGCDSIITLDLTILNALQGTDIQNACGSYTWIDGNTYIADNNTAKDTIVGGASNGCDSIITLDLTILNALQGTDVQNACGSYTWIDGNTYLADNNTARDTIVGGASNGCDSIITLNLTILSPIAGTDVQTACGSYTWIDGNTYTTNNSIAKDTIVGGASNGCDSIITLNLTILSTTTAVAVVTACGSYDWIDGNTYTANNNSAQFTLAGGASNGCDSIVTLNLTIDTIDVTTTMSGTTITASQSGANYQWIDCDNNDTVILGETSQVFTATTTGNYAVVINNGACRDTSTCVLLTTTNLNNVPLLLSDVVVYPNPTNGTLFINIGENKALSLEIFNTLGKNVYSTNLTEGITSIATDGFENGMYIINLSNESSNKLIRFIKE